MSDKTPFDPQKSTYVVQRLSTATLMVKGSKPHPDNPEVEVWVDIATVVVAARTKKRAVISEALRMAGLTPKDKPTLRVLDSENAKRLPLRPKPPLPVDEFEIC